jgi:hypothetical protein
MMLGMAYALGASIVSTRRSTVANSEPSGTPNRLALTQSSATEATPDVPLDPPNGEYVSSSQVRRGAITGNIDEVCRVVAYHVIDDMAVVEGDILLGRPDEVEASCRRAADPAAPIRGDQFRWPQGVVPYAIDTSVTEPLRVRIEQAITHWNAQQVPVVWISKDVVDAALGPVPDYVVFQSATDKCSSFIGRRGGPQVIALDFNVCSAGSIVHEMGHAVGFWHEHQRPDRDRFIEILWENIKPEAAFNFEWKGLFDIQAELSPYDYHSIMHYRQNAFSSNGQPTIRAFDEQPIGQREGLSAGDIAALHVMYPFPPACSCPENGGCVCMSS